MVVFLKIARCEIDETVTMKTQSRLKVSFRQFFSQDRPCEIQTARCVFLTQIDEFQEHRSLHQVCVPRILARTRARYL